MNRDEIIARIERLDRIVDALKAMLNGRTFTEIERAEQKLKEALTRRERGA